MTQKEKQFLLNDLCARLSYGVIYHRNDGANIELREVDIKNGTLNYTDNIVVRDCKPYLRPMSSMTEEEAFEMFRTVFHQVSLIGVDIESDRFIFKMADSDGHFAGYTILFFGKIYSLEQSDWLLSRHFDYRGLIERGLAIESPEDMYKTE